MSVTGKKVFSLSEVSEITGIEISGIAVFIQRQWIMPVQEQAESLDEEDLARIHLILELQRELGANDEAVPVILHLVDQIYCLREKLRALSLDRAPTVT